MNHIIAFSSFSIMKKPYGNPAVAGFEALTPPVFKSAENADGLIARAMEVDKLEHLSNFERDWGEWGEFAVPNYYDGGFVKATETRAGTLSIWENIESVYNFTYTGLHGKAFKNRHQWFREIDYPTHVIWWIKRGEIPTWKESVKRYNSLYQNGPTPFSFNFLSPFDAEGKQLPKLLEI